MTSRTARISIGVVAWLVSGVLVWTLAVRSAPQSQRSLRETTQSVAVTGKVRSEKLSEIEVVRGEVVPGFDLPVPSPRPAAGVRPVVTAAPPAAGAVVHGGQVLFSVASRPVIVLTGAVPLFRDLSEGMTGADVSLLQAALADVGLRVPSSEHGRFGAGTRAAVRELYLRVGSTPPIVSDADDRVADLTGQLAALDAEIDRDSTASLERSVAGAVRQLEAARTAAAVGDTLEVDTAASSVQEATDAVADQLEALAAARANRDAANQRRGAVRAELAAARAELADPTWGVQAWPDELFLIPAESAVVGLSALAVGQTTTAEPVVTLTGGTPSVWVTASAELAAATPSAGTTATANDPSHGSRVDLTFSGKGVRVIDGKRTDGWWATPTEGSLPPSGSTVVVDIVVRATPAEVLTVPVSAIRTDRSGDAVHVAGDGGRTTDVRVDVGMVAHGRAEITVLSGRLAAGDHVVLGDTGPG